MYDRLLRILASEAAPGHRVVKRLMAEADGRPFEGNTGDLKGPIIVLSQQLSSERGQGSAADDG